MKSDIAASRVALSANLCQSKSTPVFGVGPEHSSLPHKDDILASTVPSSLLCEPSNWLLTYLFFQNLCIEMIEQNLRAARMEIGIRDRSLLP